MTRGRNQEDNKTGTYGIAFEQYMLRNKLYNPYTDRGLNFLYASWTRTREESATGNPRDFEGAWAKEQCTIFAQAWVATVHKARALASKVESSDPELARKIRALVESDGRDISPALRVKLDFPDRV